MAVPINNVTRRVVYAASGTGPYNFTFEILAAGDIAVFKDDALLTLTTDYTVTINANGTGSITLVASPTGATQIAIVGNRTIQRTTDFVTGGDFFANTLNDELDQQTIFAQQNAEGLGRTLQAPQTDPTTINMTLPRATLRANKALAFDANGNPSLGDTLGTNRGNWAAGVLYYVRDIIKDTTNNNIWQCITQHTSSGSQPINTNADSAKWTLLVDAASATTSATNAAASASAASSSASAASTSASNASTSATNAAASASTATTQASNASTSATSASGSATTATTQAAAASTSATTAASSAAAAAASAASGMYSAVQDKSANYTVVAGDAGDLIRVTTTSGAVTITLPTISTVSDGFKIAIVKWTGDANAVTVARSSTNTINGATSVTIGSQYSSTIFVADFETDQWFAANSGLGTSNVSVDAFSGNNSTVAFTLSSDPGSENNTQVYVSGVYQEKDTYSVSGTTLTFSTAPPTGTSNIEVVFSTPLAIGTPSDGTVTTAKIASSVTLTTPTIDTITSASATALTLKSAGTTAITVDTSQNVGIGTSSPAPGMRLAVVGGGTQISGGTSAQAGLRVQVASGVATLTGINNDNNAYNPIAFYTGASEAARIDSNGNLCVGRSSVGAGDRFIVQTIASGTIMLGYNSSATNTYQVLDSGNVRNTNNSYGAISDQRRKENIVDATPKLEKLNQVRIVNFNIIGDGQKQIGVVAQELEQIFPGMVEEDQEGIKAVKYSVFVPMLIKAIQEQQALIIALTARITALEK